MSVIVRLHRPHEPLAPASDTGEQQTDKRLFPFPATALCLEISRPVTKKSKKTHDFSVCNNDPLPGIGGAIAKQEIERGERRHGAIVVGAHHSFTSSPKWRRSSLNHFRIDA